MTDSVDREYWVKGLDAGSGKKRPAHYVTLVIASIYVLAASLLCRIPALFSGRKEASAAGNLSVLAVGPFYSENWTAAQLDALCNSGNVAKVAVVTPRPFENKPKRQYVVFSNNIARVLGSGISRAIATLRYTLRERPDLIIGYHLPWNGVVALLASRLIGCKVWYFAVGGPAELLGGGRYSEHALFSRLDADSPFIERRLLHLVRQCDGILTMGSRAESYFRSVTGFDDVHPVAVGIETAIFGECGTAETAGRRYDIVTVGRHSHIKRIDVLLRAVALLHNEGFPVRLALVGDGELHAQLEQLAADLGISGNVHFVGWVDDVQTFLHDSKVFAMTSASEGLPHSLIESMMAGLPAVVSDVGEMSDLVEDRQTGFLVVPGDEAAFARRIRELLSNPELLAHCSREAIARAQCYSVSGRTEIWSTLLKDL